ncbi:MAG: M23 family metallopeptidase [Candidatus Zixiibacteriota bacterium]
MGSERYVTISYESGGATRTRRIKRAVALTLFGSVVGALTLTVTLFALYADSLQNEREVERQTTNEMLMTYQAKVDQLTNNMQEAQEIVSRLAGIAGVDYSPSVATDSGISFESHPMLFERDPNHSADMPSGLPVHGTIIRGFEVANYRNYHPGLDITCDENTPVLATAMGKVDYVGFDTTYGQTVIVRHNDSITTAYAHNNSIVVKEGEIVQAGKELAKSGNTGKSASPRVHYELRIHDKPIHPLEGNHD